MKEKSFSLFFPLFGPLPPYLHKSDTQASHFQESDGVDGTLPFLTLNVGTHVYTYTLSN